MSTLRETMKGYARFQCKTDFVLKTMSNVHWIHKKASKADKEQMRFRGNSAFATEKRTLSSRSTACPRRPGIPKYAVCHVSSHPCHALPHKLPCIFPGFVRWNRWGDITSCLVELSGCRFEDQLTLMSHSLKIAFVVWQALCV